MKNIRVELTDGTSLTVEKSEGPMGHQIGYQFEELVLRVWSNFYEPNGPTSEFHGSTYIYPISRVSVVTISD